MGRTDDALTLLREMKSLLKEEALIFASPEDADYFRKKLGGRKKEVPISLPPPPIPKPRPPEPVREPPPPAKAVQSIEPPPVWRQEPLPPPETKSKTSSETSFFKSLLAKIAPEVIILDEIPSDLNAKKIAHRWKTKNQTAPISILSFGEPAEQKVLLDGIAQALDVYFGPARLIGAETIENEKQWDAFLSSKDLKMIVACDYTLWQLKDLMRHYKEIPAQGIRTLGNIPLFLLPDMSLYLKDPLLKRSLWKALCLKLSS